MMRLIVLSTLYLLPIMANALEAKPVKDMAAVKGYGFNWSGDPTKATCVAITPAFIKNIKSCTYRPEGTSDTFRFECQTKKGASKQGSYLIFDTLKQCKDRKTEMEADYDGGY